MTTRLLLGTAALAAAGTLGCAADDLQNDLGSSTEEILGGQAANQASLDAVGALALIRHGRYEPFCTGTLIAPSQVLTSEHCAERYRADQIAFLIGPKTSAPKKVVRAIGSASEETLTGGVTGLGSDTAIVHLVAPVTGVAPLAIAPLTANRVGTRFDVVGYGVRDSQGRAGLRYRGSMELVGIGGTHYGQTLLAGVEAWLGGDNDDADLCHGDEGGPLLRTQGGKHTVFGVASWFPRGCFGGAIYSIVNDAVTGLVAYQAACPLVPLEGSCDGNVAVRCATPAEGDARLLRNDCGELNQTCALDDTLDTVTCVDPA